MKLLATVLFALLLAVSGQARLGETEEEMVARFGEPTNRGQHFAWLQGKNWNLGPSLTFKQDDLRITADLVDGGCVHIRYGKLGDWTEDQVKMVLAYSGQGAAWVETSKPNFAKVLRTWKRSDGGAARWRTGVGFELENPAYGRAKAVAEAKAKVGASGKPKI